MRENLIPVKHRTVFNKCEFIIAMDLIARNKYIKNLYLRFDQHQDHKFNNIDMIEMIATFSNMIKINRTIREINLSQNNLNDEMLKIILEGIHLNDKLRRLDLSSNHFSKDSNIIVENFKNKFNKLLKLII